MTRVGIMYLPSPAVTDWHASIAAVAIRSGWAVINHGEPLPEEPTSVLVICHPGVGAEPFGPKAMIVMAAPAEVVLAQLANDTGLAGRELLRTTANVLAVGAELARKGGTVVAFGSSSVDIEGLGTIVRDGRVHVAPPRFSGAPLEFYNVLPVPVGAAATWSPTTFNWIGGEDRKADLTGRRRVLQYGPYFNLFPGEWTVTTRFELAIDRAIVELRFEWGTEFDVVAMSKVLREPGIYTVTLSRVWPDVATSEFRIWLDRAVFDGQITILDCTVARSGDSLALETPSEATALAD